MRSIAFLFLFPALLGAACGPSGAASSPAPAGGSVAPAPIATSQAQAEVAATSPGNAFTEPAAARAGNDPSCEDVLTADELAGISTVDGWKLTHWDDVMPDTDVTCQWDFKLDTPEWLHAEVHVWSDRQAASFLSAGLHGDAVSRLGDGAAWDPTGGRLLVQLGNRVMGVVPGSWLGPDGTKAAAIAIANLVIPRIPG